MSLTLTPAQLDSLIGNVPSGHYVASDGDAVYSVKGILPDGTLIVRGRHVHSAWMTATVTSRTWQARPRVRFTVAQDHGYGDGRITFDGETFGGFGHRSALIAVGVNVA